MIYPSLSVLFLSGALAAPAAINQARKTDGCGLDPPHTPGSYHTGNITTVDGAREYGMWIPDNYDQDSSTPLILSYHGAGETIEIQRNLDNLTDKAFNTDHIVVYLQGAENKDDDTTWEGSPDASTDDIAFTSDLLDLLETQLCIDADRIYATGKSQGGGFVGRLACDATMSQRIAAFAPVSGAYYNSNITSSSQCNPINMTIPCAPGRHDVPMLVFHGGADTTVRYAGEFRKDACLPYIPHYVASWALWDFGLAGLEKIDNKSIPGSDHGVVMTFGDGRVKLVYDGDDIFHDWPSNFTNSDNAGKYTTAFNGTTWIMEFFGNYTLS